MVERLNDLFFDNEITTKSKLMKPGLPFLLKLGWNIKIYYLILNWGILQIHWLKLNYHK